MVVAWTGLGDRDKTICYLDEAHQANSNILPLLQVHPILDPLRSGPGFRDLLHKDGSASLETRKCPGYGVQYPGLSEIHDPASRQAGHEG